MKSTSPGTVDMLLASERFGGEPPGSQAVLDCDLGADCWTYFDEQLHVARMPRVTPAAAPLGKGEETVIDLDNSSVLLACGSYDPVTVDLFGQAGFSDAQRADASGDQPFYLGSMDLTSTPPGGSSPSQSFDLACADGSRDTVSLAKVAVRLAQPAFGVQRSGEDDVRFGPSVMQVWIDVTVDGTTDTARRPTPRDLILDHENGALDGAAINFESRVPCGTASLATLELWLDVNSGAALEAPPTAAITMPSSVSCGATVSFSGTFADPDGDLAGVRWLVDGVRLDAALTSITVNEAHEISATAYDSRGAATTVQHAIGCN